MTNWGGGGLIFFSFHPQMRSSIFYSFLATSPLLPSTAKARRRKSFLSAMRSSDIRRRLRPRRAALETLRNRKSTAGSQVLSGTNFGGGALSKTDSNRQGTLRSFCLWFWGHFFRRLRLLFESGSGDLSGENEHVFDCRRCRWAVLGDQLGVNRGRGHLHREHHSKLRKKTQMVGCAGDSRCQPVRQRKSLSPEISWQRQAQICF